MNSIKELEKFYYAVGQKNIVFGEDMVNQFLISELKTYTLSTAIKNTINHFNELLKIEKAKM